MTAYKKDKKGLVLEGGAMRGMFTAGILDVMMEHDIRPDGLIGVSAGAAFGCNYKSCQPGRAVRYNMRFARDKRYCSLRSQNMICSTEQHSRQIPWNITSCAPMWKQVRLYIRSVRKAVICSLTGFVPLRLCPYCHVS